MGCNEPLLVHIVHKSTGLAIDLEQDNKHLILKPVDSNDSQHWILQKTEWGSCILVNKKSGKALDCKKHAKTEPVNHSTSQEWFWNSYGVFRNVKHNRVLSVNKKKVGLSSIKNTANEQFCLQVCEKEVY